MRLGNRQENDFERNGEMKRLMTLVAVAAAMMAMAETEKVYGYTLAMLATRKGDGKWR